TVLVEFADIAGMKPPVHEGLARCLHVLEVATEHAVAPDQDLAVGRDADLDPWQRGADGAEASLARSVETGGRGRLGQTVALQNLDAEAIEESQDIGRDGRRPADADLDLVEPELLADLAEHQAVGHPPLPRHPGRRRLAMLVGGGSQRTHQQRPIPDDTPRTADL